MCEELTLQRFDNTPWGFRLTGGLDFGTPLTVIKVTGGSIAELNGVQVGDLIIEINGQSAKHWTHTDAQNCILASGDYITLSIMRGSELTPPEQSPLRGMSPLNGIECLSVEERNIINGYLLQDKMENMNNGSRQSFEPGLMQTEEHLMEQSSVYSEIQNEMSEKKDLLEEEIAKDVSDLEIAELLSGNEEVLDQGVLGINFKKYLPQVDFIRHSEVFKVLQNGNTHKEIPEQVQLAKDPTKRFSTFLQKPKPPSSPKPKGPYWHYPKAPRYLPREGDHEKEQPKRRVVKEKVDPGHSVLWLFMEEESGNVVDERWGTEEEELINLSRNTNREEDQWATTGGDLGKTKSHDTNVVTKEEDIVKIVRETLVQHAETINVKTEETEITEINESLEIKEELHSQTEEKVSVENINAKNNYVVDKNVDYEEDENENDHETAILNEMLEKQLADIQAQIAALEDHVPGSLQTQLLAVNEQLTKILELQTTLKQQCADQEDSDTSQKIDETPENEDAQPGNKDENDNNVLSPEETEGQELAEEAENGLQNEEEKYDEEYSTQENEITEICEKYGESDEVVLGEFEIGDAELSGKKPKPIKKSHKHPITPQARPIVLPGGRMWRNAKDAAYEEFYQGILIEQADVLVGSTVGVNFRKYVPPKFDVENSAVCKLIRELEDKANGEVAKGKPKPEDKFYQTPINKRHFYAATLPTPAPVGTVDLKDLNTDI